MFSIPSTVRPREYDRTAVLRLIHECMGIPASPPATSEDSEADSDSPPIRTNSTAPTFPQPIPIQMIPQQEKPVYNPQLIRIDERTMQLHFTPFYFGNYTLRTRPNKNSSFFFFFLHLELLETMQNKEFDQSIEIELF